MELLLKQKDFFAWAKKRYEEKHGKQPVNEDKTVSSAFWHSCLDIEFQASRKWGKSEDLKYANDSEYPGFYIQGWVLCIQVGYPEGFDFKSGTVECVVLCASSGEVRTFKTLSAIEKLLADNCVESFTVFTGC